MRLLFFCPYYPPHLGGLETYASELNAALAKDLAISSITVFTSRLPKDQPTKQTDGPITVIRYPAFELIANFPIPVFWQRRFWQLFRPLFKEEFSLIFSHTRFFVSSFLALVYQRRTHTKWIHIEHGSDYVQSTRLLVSVLSFAYDQTIGRAVLNRADGIIGVSLAVVHFIKRAFNRPAKVIYRGINSQAIQAIPADQALEKRYSGKIIITYVGRLIEGKGVIDLITAIEQLNDDRLICLIVGDGPQKKILRQLVTKKRLTNQIVFTGFKPLSGVIGTIKISDIVINPSYTEGLPTLVIEAALCQKAIIATNVGGTNEIIVNSKSGLLVEPHQPAQIASAITQLIASAELRETLGRNASVEVKNKFNWTQQTGEFLNFFNKIILSK